MKRVKVFLISTHIVIIVVFLSSIAFAWAPAVGGTVFSDCQYCGFRGRLTITSYRQATSSSSGVMSVSCPQCSKIFTRSTRFWGLDWQEHYSEIGLYDIITIECSVNNKTELGVINELQPANCFWGIRGAFDHFGHSYNAGFSPLGPPLGHNYIETSRTPATCTTPGFILSTCTRCEGTKRESIPIVPHTWTETSRTPVSCVSGTINYTCSVCSQTKTEPLPADPNAHTWTETSRTPATCLPGSIEYTCSICHDTKIESIPALENAHTYEIEEIVPAEYDSDGNLLTASYIRYACSDCGDSYNSTIGGNISGPIINEGEGGTGMGDATAVLGKTFLSGLWALFGIYVPGFSFTFGQMWLGVLLASISILVVRMMFGFGGSGPGGVSSRTGSTNNPKISKERRHDEF